jgi:hypothetical protein
LPLHFYDTAPILREFVQRKDTACSLFVALAAITSTAITIHIAAALFTFLAFVFGPERAFIGTIDLFGNGDLLAVDFNIVNGASSFLAWIRHKNSPFGFAEMENF